MRKYKDVLIENVVPKTDNAELYQDETEPKRYQTPQDDIVGIKSVSAQDYEDTDSDVFKTHEPHDRIQELLKEQYKEDDGGTITTLEDIERQMIKEGKLSEEEIEKADEPKDENKGKSKDNPEEVEPEKPMEKDKKETKEVTVEEQESQEAKESKEEKKEEKEEKEKNKEEESKEESDDSKEKEDKDKKEDDALNEELEQLLSLYEEESKIEPNQKHLQDIPESDDGEDLEDILGDEGDYVQSAAPKKEKVEIPNADSDNPSSSETTGYSDISENEINATIEELFDESYKVTFKEDEDTQVPASKEEAMDENISLFDDSEDIEEADIKNESTEVEQDDIDTITETFSDIEKNMLLDALNEDRNIEDLLDEILNEK